jgi:membrane-associated phospholipid phosphatase
MKRFSLKLFALGITLGAIGAGAVLAASAYASSKNAARPADPTYTPTTAVSAQSPDQVIQWNRVLLGILRTPGAQPPTIHPTRSMAIMHAAVYDAVNATVTTPHTDYLLHLKAPRHTSAAAAAAAAAHGVLVRLYPNQTAMLDADLAASLAQLPDGPAKDQGVQVGETAAQRMLALRANDGSATTLPLFTPGTNPGDYQLTPPAFAAPVFTQWPFVKPFTLRRANQFRPAPPPALTSPTYTAAFNEVKDLGAIGSTSRTADQTEIARFWAAPIQNYWNEIAQTVSIAHGTGLAQNARLFALLDLTLADSVIAFYDAKYTYRLWRPITAIRAADNDGNPATVADPSWTPLANTALDPSYPGAHSVVSAAGAAVLSSFFGSDSDSFNVSSEVLPGVQRSFTSFTGAANEAGLSRIYAGQHSRIDHVAGQALGRQVAAYVLKHFLLPREAVTSP